MRRRSWPVEAVVIAVVSALSCLGAAFALPGGPPGGHEDPDLSYVAAPPAEPFPDTDLAPGSTTRIVYGGDAEQNYGDLLLPETIPADGELPVVVLIHGGSWSDGVSSDSLLAHADELRDAGIAVWNIAYRRLGTGGGFPETFVDVASAVDFVGALAQHEPAIDLGNVTLVGHSAGGQLAAWAAARGQLSADQVGADPLVQPAKLVPISGVLHMAESADRDLGGSARVLGGMPEDVPAHYANIDPFQLFRHPARTIVVQGSADTLVPPSEAEAYAAELNSFTESPRAAVMALPGADHTAPLRDRWPAVRDVVTTFALGDFDQAAAALPRPARHR